MENTSVSSFTLTAYIVVEPHKQGLFALFLLIYFMIVALNIQLIAVISREKQLHQAMNVFTCNLSLNEIYGSTALLPAILSLLMSDSHEISVQGCKTQVVFLHTYASVEFSILAVMGYDRYIAVCYPLHYHSVMTVSKIRLLLCLPWVYSWLIFMSYFSLTLQLEFCGRSLHKLYCVNFELVKNSCTSSPHISVVGLLLILLLVAPQLLMILFSYMKIIRVCLKLSKESRRKVINTCFPHLISVANYTLGSLFEIVQTRFDMSKMPQESRIFLSLYFIMIPTITNPVVYGFGNQLIRVHILKFYFRFQRQVPIRAK